MKIVNVAAVPLAAKLSPDVACSVREFTCALVRVQTDEGIEGIGECIGRGAPDATAAIVNRLLGPAIIGQDPRDIEANWLRMYNTLRKKGHSAGFQIEAIAGVDIALWDILGKATGQPVYRLLGGATNEKINVYGSLTWNPSLDGLIDTIQQLVERGFKSVKFKVGRQGPEADIKNVPIVRREVGDSVKLMADANGFYDACSAIRVGRMLEEQNFFWIEEPVTHEEIQAAQSVAASLDLAVAAGECEFTRYGFQNLFSARAVDIAQPDICRAGGFTETRRIAAMASALGLPVSPHVGPSGPIDTIATLHLAAATPGVWGIEHMFVPNPIREDLLQEPLPAFTDGCADLPKGPGLGITINEDALKKYTLK